MRLGQGAFDRVGVRTTAAHTILEHQACVPEHADARDVSLLDGKEEHRISSARLLGEERLGSRVSEDKGKRLVLAIAYGSHDGAAVLSMPFQGTPGIQKRTQHSWKPMIRRQHD